MRDYFEINNIIRRKLIGNYMTNIGRAADMLWIQYGGFITAKNYKGEEVIRSEYAIHVQGSWSFMQNENILLLSDDISESKNNILFDGKNEEFIKKMLPLTVMNVDINEKGALNIFLGNNLKFQAITDKDKRIEYWRFIDNINKEHLVVFED
jgi:hypothetical protein